MAGQRARGDDQYTINLGINNTSIDIDVDH